MKMPMDALGSTPRSRGAWAALAIAAAVAGLAAAGYAACIGKVAHVEPARDGSARVVLLVEEVAASRPLAAIADAASSVSAGSWVVLVGRREPAADGVVVDAAHLMPVRFASMMPEAPFRWPEAARSFFADRRALALALGLTLLVFHRHAVKVVGRVLIGAVGSACLVIVILWGGARTGAPIPPQVLTVTLVVCIAVGFALAERYAAPADPLVGRVAVGLLTMPLVHGAAANVAPLYAVLQLAVLAGPLSRPAPQCG